MALPIALQLYTIRESMKSDFEGALREVARIGFTHVEFAGLHGRSPAEVRKLIDGLGLKAIAQHVGPDRIREDLAGVTDEAKTLGYDIIVWPWLGEAERTLEGYGKVPATLGEAKRKAPAYTFAYHNHAFEFEKLPNGQTGFDVIFSDPSVTAELDTAWVKHGGDKPVAWIEKLAGRVPMLHIKDLRAEKRNGNPIFTEVGTGVMDFAPIVKAAPGAGVRFLVVEQDNDWVDGDPLKSVALSYEGLRKITG